MGQQVNLCSELKALVVGEKKLRMKLHKLDPKLSDLIMNKLKEG